MWFLYGLLMWFGCHFTLNLCLSFSTKYKVNNDGMDLFVAIGAGVACIGATIFAFSRIDTEIAFLVGGVIGFVTGGLHFNTNVKTGELQKTILQSQNIKNNDIKQTVEMLRATLENDEFSQQNRVHNTINNSDFYKKNIVNVKVQLETFPLVFFDDPDEKITKAIETQNYKVIKEVYETFHEEAVENNDEDCECALLNIDFEHEATKGWKLAFLECLAEKKDDCFYIILALSNDGKIKRYLVAMRTSSKTNQFGYGIGELSEINPDTSNIQHGKTSTNFFDIVDAMEKVLSKTNPKAKKVFAVTSNTVKNIMTKSKSSVRASNRKSIYDDDPRYNLLKKAYTTRKGEVRISSKELDEKFEEQLTSLNENMNKAQAFYSDIALKVNAKCIIIDDGTLDIVFDNAIQKITDLVDPNLPSIYRSTANIQSLIEEPEKYLNLKVKEEILNIFGEITPANTFAFLRNHFNNKYNNRVDLIIMEWSPRLVYK